MFYKISQRCRINDKTFKLIKIKSTIFFKNFQSFAENLNLFKINFKNA